MPYNALDTTGNRRTTAGDRVQVHSDMNSSLTDGHEFAAGSIVALNRSVRQHAPGTVCADGRALPGAKLCGCRSGRQ
jgi:hypothetical protein